MALKAPTITNQSPGTAFQMANEINGLTIKLFCTFRTRIC